MRSPTDAYANDLPHIFAEVCERVEPGPRLPGHATYVRMRATSTAFRWYAGCECGWRNHFDACYTRQQALNACGDHIAIQLRALRKRNR